MYTDNISKVRLFETMISRECYYIREKIAQFSGGKYAVFSSGLMAKNVYNILLKEYKIEPEFFIDNAQEKLGETIYGKPVICEPWKTNLKFSDEYVVVIVTAWKFSHQIENQLKKAGITRYIHWWQFRISLLWECKCFSNICSMLYDELSKLSYYGAIYSMLTDNCAFIQTVNQHYFALRAFAYFEQEIFVDAGAFNGNDTIEFMKRCYGLGRSYIFEPSLSMENVLQKTKQELILQYNLLDNQIEIVPMGLGSKNIIVKEIVAPGAIGVNTTQHDIVRYDREQYVSVTTIDDYFYEKEKPTIIKADIEGMELSMLEGGQKTIKDHHPKLMIAMYHSIDDFIKIIKYLHEIVPTYKFAVRNHFFDYRDTVLYAWEEEQ